MCYKKIVLGGFEETKAIANCKVIGSKWYFIDGFLLCSRGYWPCRFI